MDAARKVEGERWEQVHDALLRVGRARCALDADEARWLREAEQIQIWRPLGLVSMIDYLERALGYAPRTAQERMRVARALGDLPELEAALADGELPFSAVKELARVATRNTEAAWRAAARDKSLREIEQLVAGHRPGDLPDDPPDEDARLHSLRFDDISASAYALFRQARQAIDRARGARVTDDELVHVLATASLERCLPDRAEAAEREPPTNDSHATHPMAPPTARGHAKHQINYTVCSHCDRAWQDGAGARVRIEASALARARCDAIEVPAPVDGKLGRATPTIPKRIRRHVFQRDAGCCQTPGCRSTLGLEIHHIVAREDGGTHDPSNLTLRCDSCHRAHHDGFLTISGTAPHAITTTRRNPIRPSTAPAPTSAPTRSPAGATTRSTTRSNPRARSSASTRSSTPSQPSVKRRASSRLDEVILREDAITALVTSGFPRGVARAAVDAARVHVGAGAPLPTLVREAFRQCGTRS